ncbi:prephenate dehydrogenase/arogenate dehydrogenase family protein [Methylophilaceae bacterium]|jgi:prephenate dehydrogenase|nr:prephenate dehydrogenase/arogenate dehydrogenase family protein [Methylophilaceae bacterium]|tara:strand:+ start:8148 stop:9011 length:864 start_codon:yes stop_codon:yes gene_type:complete
MKKLYIFGVGLIGGSIALKARELNIFDEIIGIARVGGNSLVSLVRSGVLDSSSTEIDKNIKEASLIIIATPVAQTKLILKKIEPFLQANTIITDVGSTKSNVMSEAKFVLKDKFSQFIGSHPIAGSEKHGASAAKKDLFQDKNIILTPNKENSLEQIKKLTEFWELLGGIVTNMQAKNHDQIFSTVSHLPHLLAFSLVNLINNKEDKETLLNFAASGFRDFSRIAASSPEVWKDITIQNRESIIKDLNLFQKEIIKLINLIDIKDQRKLEDYLKLASITRKDWTEES